MKRIVKAIVLGALVALPACKGALNQTSTAKDSQPVDGPSAMSARVQPLAITFMDPAKQLPVIMNVAFVFRAPQMTFDYKVQRADEQIMQVGVIKDDAACLDSSCRWYNDAEKISITFDPTGKVLAFKWHELDVDLSTVVAKAGTVDLRAVSCDMAAGTGCFP